MKIQYFGLILLMTFSAAGAFGAAPTCNRVHEISVIQSQTDVLEKHVNLLVGKKNPTWDDFDDLRAVKYNIETLIRVIRNSEGESGLVEFYKDWNIASSDLARLLKVSFQHSNLSDKYGPTDFALRKAFRDEFEGLMDLLPTSSRIKLNSIPEDKNKSELAQEAKEIVTQQEERLRQLYPTTNYKNVVELVETIREKGNPQVKENLELLLNEDFEFAMRRPESGRFWIPKVGFHNQFVTGRSKGSLNPDARNTAESALIGIDKENYEHKDNDLKPKYGFLMPKLGSGIDKSRASQYGEDIYVLNKETLRKRTTMTPGDSLGTGWEASYRMENSPTEVAHWDQSFIPWSQRALIAPTLASSAIISGVIPNKVDSIDIGDGLKPVRRYNSRSNAYVEMQYWGPVTLSEVVAFIFTKNAPSGDFLKALQKRNIKIYRKDKDNYVPWNPEDNS